MKILPLDRSTLEQASRLADTVFSHAQLNPSDDFSASLRADLHTEHQKKYNNVVSLRYWVAVDEVDDTILGTIGVYELREDLQQADWVGWFCVSPHARGQGIGKKLLRFAINRATVNGKKFLRLYTSRHHKEKDAQFLYEAHGFKITDSIGRPAGRNSTIFYREKRLDTVKAASREDLEHIKEFLAVAVRENSDFNQLTTDALPEHIGDGFLFIAVRDGVVVGAILGERLRTNKLLLRAFYVTYSCRKQGFGTQLFRKLEQKCSETRIKSIICFIPITDMQIAAFFSDASFSRGQLCREITKEYP